MNRYRMHTSTYTIHDIDKPQKETKANHRVQRYVLVPLREKVMQIKNQYQTSDALNDLKGKEESIETHHSNLKFVSNSEKVSNDLQMFY